MFDTLRDKLESVFGDGEIKHPINSIDSFMNSSLCSDDLKSQVQQMRSLGNGSLVKGYVTIIKNPGKFNEEIVCMDKENLLTNTGRDAMHDALYADTVATQKGFNFIGLSVNATPPADPDTSLTGEITTGGLARILADVHTHSVGTNVSTVQHTFTASATHTNVQKAALFDQVGPPVAGTMAHENTFTPVTLVDNDTLQVTWTVTLDDP